MNTIWDVFQFFVFVTDGARNGSLSPEQVASALAAGQLALFKQYWGDGPADKLPQSSVDALLPFSISQPITSNSAGVITLPGDYSHIRSFTTGVGSSFRKYDPVLDTELQQALNSQLYPVEVYPIYNPVGSTLQLYPNRATNGTLNYYKRPTPPVIGYTVVDQDPVYNAGASTQLQFDKKYWIEVILKALPYVGVNLADPDVFALASQFQPKAAA